LRLEHMIGLTNRFHAAAVGESALQCLDIHRSPRLCKKIAC
jgi:hypothetical protein